MTPNPTPFDWFNGFLFIGSAALAGVLIAFAMWYGIPELLP